MRYFARSFNVTEYEYAKRTRSVSIVYNDIFKLYTRILGAVAIPLLILGQIIEKIMRNAMARVMLKLMLNKKLRNGPYEWLFLGSFKHLLSKEEKSWMRAQRDVMTISKINRSLNLLKDLMFTQNARKMLNILQTPASSMDLLIDRLEKLDSDPVF